MIGGQQPAETSLWTDAPSLARFFVARKANSKRPHHPSQTFLIQHYRKGIETEFSTLTNRFPKRIHAVTAADFALKVVLFIGTHLLDKLGA